MVKTYAEQMHYSCTAKVYTENIIILFSNMGTPWNIKTYLYMYRVFYLLSSESNTI